MPLFTFGSIAAYAGLTPKVSRQSGYGPLAALDQGKYDLTILKYPQTVGGPEAPHYIRFDINVTEGSKYGLEGGGQPEMATIHQGNMDALPNAALNMSGVDIASAATVTAAFDGITALGSGSGVVGALGRGAGGALTGAIAGAVTSVLDVTVKPKTIRCASTISLYMPETVMTSYDHDWNATSLTDALGKIGFATAFGADIIKGANEIKAQWDNGQQITTNNLKKEGAEALGKFAETTGQVGGDYTTFALRSQGKAINPHLEMVFRGTANRRYVMVFDMMPRSAKEAAVIQEIIKNFRMYAAPEIADDGDGRYFIPPAQFDITYYFGGKENPFLARIARCALTNIAVNYNGSGPWTTFGDGHPVHINLSLTFAEVDTITREMIAKDGF